MFVNPPRIFAHSSSVNDGNFVSPDFILNKTNETINLFHRHCPHRMYPLHNSGDIVKNIVCKFHGFEWDEQGQPTNNNRKLHCGKADVGKSGLVFKNFKEPNHFWVDDLSKERNLVYSHAMHGKSAGSWLWMMDIQADLLHIRKGDNVVHPELAKVTDLDDINMYEGDDWILQTCSTGWWLFVYPFTFVEWSPGCLSVNYTTPNDFENEFGFTWITQFYYDPSTPEEKRKEFETLEDVFHEDVQTIEAQKGAYFPLMNSINRLEDHCIHYARWIQRNKR